MERLTIKVASAYRLPSRPIPIPTTTTTSTTSTTTNRAAAAAASSSAAAPLSTPAQPTITPTSTTTPSTTPISLETINNELLKLNGGAEVAPATFGQVFEKCNISPGTVYHQLHCTNEKLTKKFLTSEEELFTPEEEEELDNSEEGQKIFLQRLQGVYEDASQLLTS